MYTITISSACLSKKFLDPYRSWETWVHTSSYTYIMLRVSNNNKLLEAVLLKKYGQLGLRFPSIIIAT